MSPLAKEWRTKGLADLAARSRALMISRICSDWSPIVSLYGKLGARR